MKDPGSPVVAVERQRQPAARRRASDDGFAELCRLCGALSQRDTDGTVVRVFRVVVTRTGDGKTIGSSELARLGRINRLTALHHLNRLEKFGLVEKEGVGRFRMRDFDDIFDELEAHALESLKRARGIARRLGEEYAQE